MALGTGDVTPQDVIAATVACVEAHIGNPDPLAFVPGNEWKIKRRTERIGGERRELFGAEHRTLNLRLQYQAGRSCDVFAFLPRRLPASDGSDEASSAVVIGGARSALSGTHPIGSERKQNDGYTILIGDKFEIDFTYVESGFDENLFYLITVRAPKQASTE